MGGLVKALFGDNSAEKAAQQQQELARISQSRQEQMAQEEAARTSGQLAAVKSVRGQRLLMSTQSGGLASTVGGA